MNLGLKRVILFEAFVTEKKFERAFVVSRVAVPESVGVEVFEVHPETVVWWRYDL